MPALSADGDFRGTDGYGKKGYSFVLSLGQNIDVGNEKIELLIDFDETYSAAKGTRPPKPDLKNTVRGKGCFVHPYGNPKEIRCEVNAVPSIFSGIVYARRLHKNGEQYFVCIKNCSKRAPRVLVWYTERE